MVTKTKITTLALWILNTPAFKIQYALFLQPKVMDERKLAIKENI